MNEKSPEKIRRRLARAALALRGAAWLCALAAPGCTQLVNEGPVAYGANGLSAPRVYTVAPQAPRSMGSPAIAMATQPVNERPVLPALDNMPGAQPRWPGRGLREPLMAGPNPDLADSRPLTVEGLNPKAPMPVEQKVYGGVYPEESADAPYLHQIGDRVSIRIVEQPELSGLAVVERDGRLRIPGTEDFVAAKGLDATQIASAVARAVRPYVRKFPVVRVVTEQASGGYYYVLGGVKNQGRFPLGMSPVTLSEAVFRANSSLLARPRTLDAEGNAPGRENFQTAGNAALERVLLITPHRTAPQAAVYNVAAALYGGVGAQNPVIKPGQIIVVGQNDNLRIEEYIRMALARDNKRAPLLKTYDEGDGKKPYLDSPNLDVYAPSILPQ
ncbi:MAG: polysaccharide biosynthesis/export family protein [Planctomycetes bacterium]|nr:polysaccharide biosynthesis/export family protein [Planctomycetota bacterium]